MAEEVRFYHLQRSTVEAALPQLLEKVISQGRRAVVAGDPRRLEALDASLWTYRPDSFVPHGRAGADDAFAEEQPVWLVPDGTNANGADVLFVLDGVAVPMTDFKLVCDIFHGGDEASLEAARGRWKALKDSGCQLTYWQQGEKGWEKKA